MALMLPYPTYTPFAQTTVHSNVEHNAPHAGLLSNDDYLAAQIDASNAAIAALQAMPLSTFYRLIMAELYRINNRVFGTADMPPEFVTAGSVNMGNNGTWQTHAYPGSIPSSAKSVIMQCFIATSYNSNAYVRFKTASLFPDAIVAESYSRAGSDDTAGNTVVVEMPYESSRTFQSFCHLKEGTGAIILFAVGYRT